MDSLNLNLYNILIILGVLHGIIFSLILLLNHKLKSKTNTYLALTILSLCFSNLQYWFLDVGITPGYENINLIFIPFEFLMVPLFFLFVKSYLSIHFSNKHVFLLLIPFFITVLYLILNKIFKIDSAAFKFFNLVIEYCSLLFSITILILIFKTILDYEKEIIKDTFLDAPKTIRWLKKTLAFGLILCLLWGITLSFLGQYFPKGYYIFYPLWIGISILIYWIAYTSIFQNSIYKERVEIRGKLANINYLRNPLQKTLTEKVIKSRNDKLSENINPERFKEINILIVNKKLFLNPKLSLKIIANKVNLSEGYLSQLINSNTNKNFNEYINALRIENVKKLLLDKDYSRYTITAIGLESGFNTKTSFYNAFKKSTGLTPNNYKKLVQNH